MSLNLVGLRVLRVSVVDYDKAKGARRSPHGGERTRRDSY
jgi:hypothetical protein